MDTYLNPTSDHPDWLNDDDGDSSKLAGGTEPSAAFPSLDGLLVAQEDLFGSLDSTAAVVGAGSGDEQPSFDMFDPAFTNSSPESSGSSHGAPFEVGNEVSWAGILEQPIFPQSDESPSSLGLSPPEVPFMAFGGSPITSPQSPPAPTPVPAGGFPPFSMADRTPAGFAPPPVNAQATPVVNLELAKLLASMAQYNDRYGTLLPTPSLSAPAPTSAPAPAPHPPLPAQTAFAAPSSASGSSKRAGSASSAHADSEDDDELRPLRSFREDSTVTDVGASSSSSGRPAMSAKAAAKRVASGHLMSSVVVEDESERQEGEDWRPTPEEYAKLDSKQKRQLRNKQSAKAFRNRRKDYIDKLEGHLSERDRLLEFVREEMRRKEQENEELRREMAVLRNTVSVFNSTALSVNGFTSSGSSSQTAQASEPSPSNVAAAFPIDPFAVDSQSFWSSTTSPFSLNPMIQHAALPPPSKPEPQPNLNPLLQTLPSMKPSAAHKPAQNGTFEQFADATPFSVRQATVDTYRSQLWARLAREAAYTGVHEEEKLALKPLFFSLPPAEVKTFGPSASVSRGGQGVFTSRSPASPVSSSSASSAAALIAAHAASTAPGVEDDNAHLVLLANVAQQTITSKLTSAFLDAFVVAPAVPSPSPAPSRSLLDADKMAAVVTGKSRLEVVPVDAPAPAVRTRVGPECTVSAGIEKALAALTLSFSPPTKTTTADVTPVQPQQPKKVGWRQMLCPTRIKEITSA